MVEYSIVESDFSQDFQRDTGVSGGATGAWPDSDHFPGWSAYFGGTQSSPDVLYYDSAPQDGAFFFQAWRRNTSDTDFALGAYPTSASGDVHFGLSLTNTTGATLNNFSFGYTGEQWRAGTTEMNQQLLVSYQIGSIDNLEDGVWTEIPELTFNSILDFTTAANTSQATKLDGRLPENTIVFDPVLVSGVSWEDGAVLTLRFTDIDDLESEREHALAVDDIRFTAGISSVPEPGSVGLWLALAGAVAVLRRRTRPTSSNCPLARG